MDSVEHGDVAVVLWAHYEDLMAPGIDGGRAPARARRRVVAEAFGLSVGAVDDARRELLAEGAGGPWLRRSSPQGAKRATRHVALQRPKDTGDAFVRVPRWTRERVWLGRDRVDGQITAGAWRLYAKALRRTGHEGGTFEASMAALGAMIQASGSTARRRLAELEAAGMAEVTERPGCWPRIRFVVDADDAVKVAEHYREHGRRTANPPRDPYQTAALTPTKLRHSPLSDPGTPQETHPEKPDLEETPELPPVGVKAEPVARERDAADAGTQDPSPSGTASARVPRRARRGGSPDAVRILRSQMPRTLLARVPEHGIRRVLRALDEELQHRSAAELAARIGTRWEAWRYRAEDIQDPTAVAITITRRGYDCPDVRCEHRVNLDTLRPCAACTAPPNDPIITAPTPSEPLSAPQALEQPSQGGQTLPRSLLPVSGTITPPPAAIALGDRSAEAVASYVRSATQGGALARALLTARTDAERDALLAAIQAEDDNPA